jgi:AcrR family transcriptional regulator
VTDPAGSARRQELLEAAYRYVLEHGLATLSLRPLAGAIGASPRVLLFLFESKEGLVRALLARARHDELVLLEDLGPLGAGGGPGDLPAVARRVWRWLAEPAHRPLLGLWVEAYGRSLVEPDGPWAGFARATVDDWLALLARAQPPRRRSSAIGAAERTAVLGVLRGALLDLLATGDARRTTAAVDRALAALHDHDG